MARKHDKDELIIHVMHGYDSLKAPNGEDCFGCYINREYEENPIIEYQYTEEYIQYKNGESIFKEKSRLNSMVSISNVEKI